MDMMTQIRQMQAEAFINAGFTPDEVIKKFGILPMKVQASEPAPVKVARRARRRQVPAETRAKAYEAIRQKSAAILAVRRPIIEDAIARKLPYSDIALLIAKKEGGEPISVGSLCGYMKRNGIKGMGSGRQLGGGASTDIGHVCMMLREHFTASQIAVILGVSRNAVIGHWFRNKGE